MNRTPTEQATLHEESMRSLDKAASVKAETTDETMYHLLRALTFAVLSVGEQGNLGGES